MAWITRSRLLSSSSQMISSRFAAVSGPIAKTIGRICVWFEVEDFDCVGDCVNDVGIADTVLVGRFVDLHTGLS